MLEVSCAVVLAGPDYPSRAAGFHMGDGVTPETKVALVAIWDALLANGFRPSANAVIACVRRAGGSFRNDEGYEALRLMRGAPNRSPSLPGAQNEHVGSDGALPIAPGSALVRGRARRSQGIRLELGSDYEKPNGFSPSSPPVGGEDSKSATAAKKAGSGRSPQLRLPNPHRDRGDAILALFWPRLEPSIGRAMTKTQWRSRNKRAAESLAALDRTDADLLAAHERLSARFGSPVYMLAKLSDELIRLDGERNQGAEGGADESVDGADENSFPLFEDLVKSGVIK